MGWLVIVGLVCGAAWLWQAGFAEGKRVGSRKGYGVGYDRGRRSVSLAPAGEAVPAWVWVVLGLLLLWWLAG